MSWTLVGIVAVVATASRGSHAFGAARDRDRVDGRSWVRLCTLTKNGGSSRVDVAMPCGVRVENDRSDTLDRPDGGFVRIDRGDAENEGPERPETSTGRTADDAFENVGGDPSEIVPGNVGVRRNDSKNRANATEERVAGIHDRNDGESSDYDDDDDDESTTVLENGEYPEPAVGDGAIPVGYGESDGGVDYEDGVVVRVEDDRRNELDKRHGSVAKVMLEYLADAKNQFYNRIRTYIQKIRLQCAIGFVHAHRANSSLRRKRQTELRVFSTAFPLRIVTK